MRRTAGRVGDLPGKPAPRGLDGRTIPQTAGRALITSSATEGNPNLLANEIARTSFPEYLSDGGRFHEEQPMFVKVFSVYPADGSGTKRTAVAVDLASDLWEDFQHYLAEAKRETDSDVPSPAANRAIRGAIWCLCNHVEGVISGLHEQLRSEDGGFEYEYQQRLRRDKGKDKLCGKVLDLRKHAGARKNVRLSYLDLRLKLFRDIIAHPGITKEDKLRSPVQVLTFPGGQPELKGCETAILTEVELYLLRPADIEADAQGIDNWLTRLCELYKYPRFPDTKLALEEALRPYGGGSSAVHKI
jgi:hypothetical protein